MADYASRYVNTSFKGLSTTVGLFAIIGGICLVGFETMRQLRRLPQVAFVPFWKRDRRTRQGGKGGVDGGEVGRGPDKAIGSRQILTSEDWEMGHLYLARMFHAITPTPPMASWPLAWAYQALKLDDWFYATHTGMDTVVYVRFLKGCVYWALLQTLTTAPILLAIHLTFAQGASRSDMNSASLSYLVVSCDPKGGNLVTCNRVPNEAGRRLLWIHLCLLWYITLTWFYTLWWIGKGSLRIRSRWIKELRKRRKDEMEEMKAERMADTAGTEANTDRVLEEVHRIGSKSQGDDSHGWRQRTLLVTNLPPTMRDEASVRRYFEEFLRPDDGTPMSSTEDLHHNNADGKSRDTVKLDGLGHVNDHLSDLEKTNDSSDDSKFRGWEEGNAREAKYTSNAVGPEPDIRPHRHLRSPIQTVVLVRKMNELSAMLSRRQEVLGQLEAAHIKLAQGVITKVGQQTRKMQRENKARKTDKVSPDAADARSTGTQVLNLFKFSRTSEVDKTLDVEKDAATELREDTLRFNELSHRFAKFVEEKQGTTKTAWTGNTSNSTTTSVWEALAEAPRDLLDPFQPVTRLSSLFRGQKVPTIDYLLTKLNLLTALVTEMRARPPTSYEPTSTAFVTFRDPRQARMVWRELKSQIVVKVRLAPEVKDLDWERLMRTSFTGDIVRGVGVNVFFWLATIIWVIPVSLFTTSLFSVNKLEGLFPSVSRFFSDNPNFEGFVSNTLPSLIVSILTMCVPELIFQISKRAQGFVTFSALYDQCLCRYWKFVICNVVIFFCVGATTVESVILQAGRDNKLLDSIAFAFPTAAPFYISYLILGLALHTGFELLGFMVPLIQHLGARKAATPRVRALKTLPRNFNRYYWLPFHVLILSIVFLFALLNPLVIPFALVYLFVALVVFKKNLAYTYFRRFNEMEGVVYFLRLLRFSLDGLLVGQIVILIFFSVTQQSAVYIALTAVLLPFNVIVKLLATRLWKSQCRALEDEEANALCGIGSSEALTPSANKRDYFGKNSTYGHSNDEEQLEYTSPLDARASGRYPPVVVAPQTSSKVFLAWNYIHDRFNANGNDRPSYVVNAQARGSHLSAKIVTNAVASAPKVIAQSAVGKKRHLSFVTNKNGRNASKLQEVLTKEDAVLPTSTKAFKESLEQTQEETRRRKVKSFKQLSLKRGPSGRSARSARSDEAPFLSGIDAIANHAPVTNQELLDDSDFEDGELDRALSLHRRTRKNRYNYSTTIVKGKPVMDVGDGSYLSTARETDEASIRHSLNGQTQEEGIEKQQQEDREDTAGEEEEEDDDDEEEEEAMVKPHAKIRWDDTPNNSARYNNPFYSVELDPFLWLPRDPMRPIDLCDTVEWHGAALVSSQGGGGKVGEWDDEQEGDEDGSEEGMTHVLEEEGEKNHGLHGDEQIEIIGPLAQRLQEAEDMEEAVDIAASISRNQLEDYKRALDEEEGEYEHHGRKHHRFSMRSSSIRSRQSHRQSFGSESNIHRVLSGLSTYSAEDAGSVIQEQVEEEQRNGQGDDSIAVEEGITQSPSVLSNNGAMATSSANQLEPSMPSMPSMRRIKARDPSNKTLDTVLDHGNDGTSPKNRKVSMRKALKAEVLEEEYRRTIKAKVQERKKREKSEMDAAGKHHNHNKAPTTDNEMEMNDLEAQRNAKEATDSAIMTRHEHLRQNRPSTSRREGNMSISSVKAAVSSAFLPRRSDGPSTVKEQAT